MQNTSMIGYGLYAWHLLLQGVSSRLQHVELAMASGPPGCRQHNREEEAITSRCVSLLKGEVRFGTPGVQGERGFKTSGIDSGKLGGFDSLHTAPADSYPLKDRKGSGTKHHRPSTERDSVSLLRDVTDVVQIPSRSPHYGSEFTRCFAGSSAQPTPEPGVNMAPYHGLNERWYVSNPAFMA
jgi:hypothetical protein